MCNDRHPGPRREEPRVGSGPDVAFPVDPVESSRSGAEFREAHFYCEKQCFFTILRENDRHFWGVELLGALLAPRWPQMRSRPPVELHLEASWSLCWRQDGPSGAKMGQVGTKLAVKFGKLRTKRRILYIYKPPIHHIHAAG